MNIENKLKLITKLYSNKKDYNYFFNPYYSRKSINFLELKNKWQELYNIDPNHLTHFYIHTPFCLEKCKFCQYNSGFNVEDSDTIEKYLSYLESYILEFSDIFKGKKFGGLYFGGGTASLYSEKQLDRLLKVIFDNINFNGDYLKEYELHPITTTLKKLEILKKYGIDRITFGIQSFNKKTIDNEGRIYCSPEHFKNLISYAKKLGFTSINADLILGLNSETKEESLESLRQMFDCNPYTITLYTLQDNKEKSDLYEDSDSFYKNIELIHDYLLKNLIDKSDYNFSCSNINTGAVLSLKGVELSNKKRYDTHVNRIESIFGVGFGSYSHIFGYGKYYIPDNLYNHKNIYLNFEELNFEDEKEIFLARFIQEGEIDLGFFKNNYNTDILIDKKDIIDILLDLGKIHIEDESIKFNNNGIKDRYIYGLMFFDLKFILHHSLYIDKKFKK